MVGCWNLGLKMIPNDRPSSSLGLPGDFGQKIPISDRLFLIFGPPGGPGFPVHCGISINSVYKRLGPNCALTLARTRKRRPTTCCGNKPCPSPSWEGVPSPPEAAGPLLPGRGGPLLLPFAAGGEVPRARFFLEGSDCDKRPSRLYGDTCD